MATGLRASAAAALALVAAASLVAAAGASRIAVPLPEGLAELELRAERPGRKKKKGPARGGAAEGQPASAYPEVTLGDLSRQDRDLLESKRLLAGLGGFSERLQQAAQEVAGLGPGFEITEDHTNLRRELQVDRVDCSKRKSIVFSGKFTDRGSHAKLRLVSRGGDKYDISLLLDAAAKPRWHQAPLQLYPWAELEEERAPEGGLSVPVTLSGSVGARLRPKMLLSGPEVQDALRDACTWSTSKWWTTTLKVEISLLTIRGRNLVAFQKALESLHDFFKEGSGWDGPLLRLQELGKASLSALQMARYALHPYYSLVYDANLTYVKQQLTDVMGSLDMELQSVKEWRGEVEGKFEELRLGCERALGGSAEIAESLRNQVPEDWLPGEFGATLEQTQKTLERLWVAAVFAHAPIASAYARAQRLLSPADEAPAPVKGSAGASAVEGTEASKLLSSSAADPTAEEDYDFLRAFVMMDFLRVQSGDNLMAYSKRLLQATVERTQKTLGHLEHLGADAAERTQRTLEQFGVHAPITSAYARAQRLLLGSSGVSAGADASAGAVTSEDASETLSASTSHLFAGENLSAFPINDLPAQSGDNLTAHYERLSRVNQELLQAIYLLARDALRGDEDDVSAAATPTDVKLLLVQGALRQSAAFGYTTLLLGAEDDDRMMKRLGFRLPFLAQWPLTGRWGKAKKSWAKHWAALRASMDFAVWPVGSSEQPMAKPKFCQSSYNILGTDEEVRYPAWMGPYGNQPIPHEFLVFAGGKLPVRENCAEVLTKLADEFPLLSRTKRSKNTRFRHLHEKAGSLGCLGLEHWGETGGRVRREFGRLVGAWQNITVSIELRGERGEHITREVSILGIAEREMKLRRPSNRPKKAPKLSELVTDAVVNYALHTVTKYAAKSEPGADFEQGVRASLLRHPPSITPQDLSIDYAGQLKAQNLTSPFDPERCVNEEQVGSGGCREFKDWDSSVPGFWDAARLAGDSLTRLFEALEVALQAPAAPDTAALAQTPAVLAAVGFDAPGVIDNGGWTCEETRQVCNVHPRCGRIAAQMLQYPFGGHKKYASSLPDKAETFVKASQLPSLKNLDGARKIVDGARKFYFDNDGFHGYCHRPGKAYCWSYTACLREMMNWLCHQPETAEHCCPSPDVREACSEDVNGRACEVCQDPPEVDQDPSEVDQESDGIIDAEPLPEELEELDEFLRPLPEDRPALAPHHIHESDQHDIHQKKFEWKKDRPALVPHHIHEGADDSGYTDDQASGPHLIHESEEDWEDEDRRASVEHIIQSDAPIYVDFDEDE